MVCMQLARTLRKAWRSEKKSIEEELAKQPVAVAKASTPSSATATTATTSSTSPVPTKDVSASPIAPKAPSSSSGTPAVESQLSIPPATTSTATTTVATASASLPVEVVPDKEVLATTLQEAVDLLCQLDTKSYFAYPVSYHPISSLYFTSQRLSLDTLHTSYIYNTG